MDSKEKHNVEFPIFLGAPKGSSEYFYEKYKKQEAGLVEPYPTDWVEETSDLSEQQWVDWKSEIKIKRY